jgi:hypothetical protein
MITGLKLLLKQNTDRLLLCHLVNTIQTLRLGFRLRRIKRLLADRTTPQVLVLLDAVRT